MERPGAEHEGCHDRDSNDGRHEGQGPGLALQIEVGGWTLARFHGRLPLLWPDAPDRRALRSGDLGEIVLESRSL